MRTRAAAWVAGQVSRTAVVACDPVMCQALRSHGVLASRLYQLGPQTTSPLRSQIIVATAAVRAQFGNVLSSVYAPAVLASFGFGPDRIDIRQTAQHGAAAYRAMLRADLANRRASGAQLLHSGRIAAAPIARRQLATGEVDGRLLLAIAQMAAAHPMFIVDFGIPAPGAGPDMPLRQADLAEDAHARHHAGHVSAGYVRSMVSFLRRAARRVPARAGADGAPGPWPDRAPHRVHRAQPAGPPRPARLTRHQIAAGATPRRMCRSQGRWSRALRLSGCGAPSAQCWSSRGTQPQARRSMAELPLAPTPRTRSWRAAGPQPALREAVPCHAAP